MHTGRLGEAIAARALERKGWRVLARRWRDGPRELDLVVQRGDVLAFVEVKTRRRGGLEAALESLTAGKRRDLERAAGAWLRSPAVRELRVRRIRFDVVAVLLAPFERPRVHHLEEAWVRGDRLR
jgi:putative endonuclease